MNLGDRMKTYERTTPNVLPDYGPDTYFIVRIDGKAFHTLTASMNKPFDSNFSDAMGHTSNLLQKNIAGCLISYTQSDEISLILKRLRPESQFYFGGKLQKLVSVIASEATLHFNDILRHSCPDRRGLFDARIFAVPNVIEANNYLRWRIYDARTNFINAICHQVFSTKELQGVSQDDRKQMLIDAGHSPEHYSDRDEFGEMTIVNRPPFHPWDFESYNYVTRATNAALVSLDIEI